MGTGHDPGDVRHVEPPNHRLQPSAARVPRWFMWP